MAEAMRRRDLRKYGVRGYIRTDAPTEAWNAYVRRFGTAPAKSLRTFQHWWTIGLVERLPFEWIDDVMDGALPRPERFGYEIEVKITRQSSAFAVIREFPSIIATSKTAQAGIARAHRTGPSVAAPTDTTGAPPLPPGTPRTR